MRHLALLLGLVLPYAMIAQTILGKVTNDRNEALPGASVYWAETATGTSTGLKGEFELSIEDVTDRHLIAAYVGFKPDTVLVGDEVFIEFRLRSASSLDEVTIRADRPGVIISNKVAIKTEQITKTELGKSACCDLAGCFETQTTVQPQTTNVLTNSTELRILGLSGVYNQILVDGFPLIQGLSYTYGISSIPGPMVENIYVSKGANSVLQGFESISGQINVETVDPDNTDKLLVNLYLNSFMEKQVNASYAVNKGKWSNLTFLHTTQPANKVDRDDDTFLDLPLLTRYMVANKWKYGNEQDWGWSSRIGLRFVHEQRLGGQMEFDQDTDEGSNHVYGQTVSFNQPEVWTKTGYRFNDKHNLVAFASAFHHNQNSYFGTVNYDARQTNVYGNIQYELNYGSHVIKTGASYRHMLSQEDISFSDTTLNRTYDGSFEKRENITGVFAENTMEFFNGKLTWIAGLRADHHNKFGLTATPRTLIKYDITTNTTVRSNFGTGWRTANLLSENINLLVSSRDIVVIEDLRPERATNFGINLTQKFNTGSEILSGYLSADFYRTDFRNQIFPDYNSEPTKAIIENFEGTSRSNGFQAELFVNIWTRFDLKLGYNYLDVYRIEDSKKQVLPFNSRHKLMTSFSYKPLSKKYHFDMNVHWYGQQRLPDTGSNPPEYQRPDYSDPYVVVNAQFTYSFKLFEVYVGCENILDFRQRRPIISWEDPFGPYFDTSSVWGPTRGREAFIGVRFTLSN